MKISVITINYNNASGLQQTIKSVINQENIIFEYIIIDGGSTDGSVNIIKEHSNHIDYWISEKDNGIYHAMNKGVKASTGDYLIFMNSGDSFHSNQVLYKVSKACNNSDIMVGIEWCFKKNIKSKRMPPQQINLETSMSVMHQAAFIKKTLLVTYPYDETYKIAGDIKFFTDAFIKGNCSYQRLDIEISNFNLEGISNSIKRQPESPRIYKELFEYLKIPERVINSFYEYKYGKNDLERKIKEMGYNTYSYNITLGFVTILTILKKWKENIQYKRKR